MNTVTTTTRPKKLRKLSYSEREMCKAYNIPEDAMRRGVDQRLAKAERDNPDIIRGLFYIMLVVVGIPLAVLLLGFIIAMAIYGLVHSGPTTRPAPVASATLLPERLNRLTSPMEANDASHASHSDDRGRMPVGRSKLGGVSEGVFPVRGGTISSHSGESTSHGGIRGLLSTSLPSYLSCADSSETTACSVQIEQETQAVAASAGMVDAASPPGTSGSAAGGYHGSHAAAMESPCAA